MSKVRKTEPARCKFRLGCYAIWPHAKAKTKPTNSTNSRTQKITMVRMSKERGTVTMRTSSGEANSYHSLNDTDRDTWPRNSKNVVY